MSLTSLKLLSAPAVQWIYGKWESFSKQLSQTCVCSRSVLHERRQPWSNAVRLLSVFHQLSLTIYLCVAKTFALMIHSYTLDVFTMLFWGEKKKKRQKRKRKKKKSCFLLYSIPECQAQVLITPVRGYLTALERGELLSWNSICALHRRLL